MMTNNTAHKIVWKIANVKDENMWNIEHNAVCKMYEILWKCFLFYKWLSPQINGIKAQFTSSSIKWKFCMCHTKKKCEIKQKIQIIPCNTCSQLIGIIIIIWKVTNKTAI